MLRCLSCRGGVREVWRATRAEERGVARTGAEELIAARRVMPPARASSPGRRSEESHCSLTRQLSRRRTRSTTSSATATRTARPASARRAAQALLRSRLGVRAGSRPARRVLILRRRSRASVRAIRLRHGRRRRRPGAAWCQSRACSSGTATSGAPSAPAAHRGEAILVRVARAARWGARTARAHGRDGQRSGSVGLLVVAVVDHDASARARCSPARGRRRSRDVPALQEGSAAWPEGRAALSTAVRHGGQRKAKQRRRLVGASVRRRRWRPGTARSAARTPTARPERLQMYDGAELRVGVDACSQTRDVRARIAIALERTDDSASQRLLRYCLCGWQEHIRACKRRR